MSNWSEAGRTGVNSAGPQRGLVEPTRGPICWRFALDEFELMASSYLSKRIP